ncbi:MAG: prepilin-type N-terminal cleavage/methylation domain-containing protein [Bryobacterales bacterium]|nr:prepilin-type N-terminal cleavage/methylation domain-containing protein [Bryobacterales bacterium]MBV9397151.1 prepilin-type N-terminal cleavage/methylation domain-containing protein [Bryobacterales bacterium]
MPTSGVGAANSRVGQVANLRAIANRAGQAVGRLTRRVSNPPQVGNLPHRGACSQTGVTLLELLIVMTIVALLAGLSYPSVSSGIDSMRLRSAADRVASFLNVAMDRADRKQQVVEIRISPAENAIGARSADLSFDRKAEIPDSVRIASIDPPLVNGTESDAARRFLIYPGGTLPRIVIGLVSKDGRKRQVIIDPMTGMPRTEAQ